MPTEEQIRESLDEVLVPTAMRSVGRLNLVREVSVSDQKVPRIFLQDALVDLDGLFFSLLHFVDSSQIEQHHLGARGKLECLFQ